MQSNIVFWLYRIGDRACEQKQLLQEEIDDREGFNTEAQQTVEWLTETKAELAQLAPCMEEPDIIEKIEKIKVTCKVFLLFISK